MKGREFGFDNVYLLYYKCHRINPSQGGSYKDSPDQDKKKATKMLSIQKIINGFDTP